MAIYKIFPEKSATLYSYYPTLNSGLDEILELSTFESIEGTNEVARPIIKFPQSEITDIINNKVNGANYNAFLRLSLANASQVPLDYTIYCHPLVYDWNIGTGRFANSPITTDGTSWEYTDQLGGNVWVNPNSYPAGATASYSTNVGGGLWWDPQYVSYATQSFSHASSLDIKIDITGIVDEWYNNDYDNYGFILKHSELLEFTTASKFETKYFSGETHTIYPPCLEIRWNDFIYNTGSLAFVTSPNIVATLANNQSEYQQGSVQRFRINLRDRYPARSFQATSVYVTNKVFLESSNPLYSIKDLDTEEIVIDYDPTYTKVCADPSGNYFDIYMNGLEPERYYQILIKATIDGTTLVLDNNYYFKVIR